MGLRSKTPTIVKLLAAVQPVCSKASLHHSAWHRWPLILTFFHLTFYKRKLVTPNCPILPDIENNIFITKKRRVLYHVETDQQFHHPFSEQGM